MSGTKIVKYAPKTGLETEDPVDCNNNRGIKFWNWSTKKLEHSFTTASAEIIDVLGKALSKNRSLWIEAHQ